MKVEKEKTGSVMVLEISGKLDAVTAPDLEKEIVGLIEGGDVQLCLDLSDLMYISSAGLRVMLMAAKKIRQKEGKIVLCALQDQIREVFDIAGFTPLFPISDTRAEAIDEF